MTEQEIQKQANIKRLKDVYDRVIEQQAVEQSSNQELNFNEDVYDKDWFSLDSE